MRSTAGTRSTAIGSGRAVVERHASVGDATVRVTKTVALGGDRRAPTLDPDRRSRQRLRPNGRGRPRCRVDDHAARGWREPGRVVRGGRSARAPTTARARSRRSRPSPRGTTRSASRSRRDLSEPADLWWAPVETVSNSEGGFERSYQGAGILVSWPLALPPGASLSVTMANAVTTTADLAVAERGSVD